MSDSRLPSFGGTIMAKETDNIMDYLIKGFGGNRDERQKAYDLIAKNFEGLAKGHDVAELRKDIMGLAVKSGAPLDEVQKYLAPLGMLSKEAGEAAVMKFMESGGLAKAVLAAGNAQKAEYERKSEMLEQMKRIKADIDSKRPWWQRLFS
jgi:hypothetical protein